MSDDVTIRRAESVADYLACQQAQRLAWGITDDSYVVPLATMVGAQLHGGLVLGAFTPDGDALGLSFAFLGKVEGRPCLYSQLTGIVPGQQGKGLGLKLKLAQRDWARGEGLACLAWSYDPLQAGNARFNLEHLGATADRYVVDMYGRRTDALNVNAPTDRLIVEWSTDPDLTRRSPIITPDGLPRLLEAREGRPDTREISSLDPSDSTVLIEIPADVAASRRDHPASAEGWTFAVRRAFLDAFAAGFRAEGFSREEGQAGRRCFYVLNRHRTNPGIPVIPIALTG